MQTMNRETRVILHGIGSVLLGFAVFWFMMAVPPVRYVCIDGTNTLLYIPEWPSMALRNVLKYSSNWVLERETLHERVSKLEAENQKMSAALQLTGAKPAVSAAMFIPARVTLRYPEEWWREIRIDKGRANKVKEGAAVTSDGYLIGRVTRVGAHYAWVELITSASFLIAVAVDETRDLGVVNGDDKGNLALLYIPEDRKIKPGMNISTSLMSDEIPPGLPIGTIIAADKVKEGFVPMKVKAGAHLTQMYNVEVFSSGAEVSK